jgi:hypothetical protein
MERWEAQLSLSLEERVSSYMEHVDPAVSGQGGHSSALWAASVLVWGFALSEADAWPFAIAYNSRCEPPWNERELRRKLSQAANPTNPKYPRGYLLGDHTTQDLDRRNPPTLPPPPSKPEYEPETLKRLTSKIKDDISDSWLEVRSKFTCWNRSPAGVLHKLFRPGEHVIVFNVFHDQGCEVWTHPGLSGNLATLDYLEHGQKFGVWFMANPVDGEYHFNPRQGHDSRRSKESVTSWRYLVVESDHAPADLWLRALVQLPLRIAAIYTSGSRSIHALVRVDAGSKADWDDIKRHIAPILIPLGACSGTITAVRLTRLPNCRRDETRQLQRLLYLTDEPSPVPICELPLRESSETARKRSAGEWPTRWGAHVA